jgi:hypothetical protein
MNNNKSLVSSDRLYRIRCQGYAGYSDKDLSELAFGNRFAYYLCSFLLLIGIVSANIPILSIMTIVALFGIILPNHPFDYIFNILLSPSLNKPKLPRRSNQLKFACLIATIWLAVTIYLFSVGITIAGYVAGGILFFVAILVSTTDVCIPSLIYNFLFNYKVR